MQLTRTYKIAFVVLGVLIALGVLAFLILGKLLLKYDPAQAEADDAAAACEAA